MRHIFSIIPDVIIGGICAITVSVGIYLLWLCLAGNMELGLLGGSFVLIASPAYSVYKRLITGRWVNMGGGYGEYGGGGGGGCGGCGGGCGGCGGG